MTPSGLRITLLKNRKARKDKEALMDSSGILEVSEASGLFLIVVNNSSRTKKGI
jgi:hypothetical protein